MRGLAIVLQSVYNKKVGCDSNAGSVLRIGTELPAESVCPVYFMPGER